LTGRLGEGRRKGDGGEAEGRWMRGGKRGKVRMTFGRNNNRCRKEGVGTWEATVLIEEKTPAAKMPGTESMQDE